TITEEYNRSWREACDRVREEQRKQEETRRKLIQTGRDEGNAEREQLKAESARQREQLEAESARQREQLEAESARQREQLEAESARQREQLEAE
ncbi:hypothetical protein SERLA73DRAFT_81378, partial [Serpula lacrymans var. lacrymans S7.3]